MPFKDCSRVHANAPASRTLQLGQRVIRKDTTEGGTVVAADAKEIKVKWDRGKTSFYRRGAQGNVLHAPPPPAEPRTQVATYFSSDDLDMLTLVLTNHCKAHDIHPGTERDSVARLAILLFSRGITSADEMQAALIASRRVH